MQVRSPQAPPIQQVESTKVTIRQQSETIRITSKKTAAASSMGSSRANVKDESIQKMQQELQEFVNLQRLNDKRNKAEGRTSTANKEDWKSHCKVEPGAVHVRSPVSEKAETARREELRRQQKLDEAAKVPNTSNPRSSGTTAEDDEEISDRDLLAALQALGPGHDEINKQASVEEESY